MNLAGVLFVGSGPTDDGTKNDERRLVGRGLSFIYRSVESFDVFNVFAGLLPVDHLYVPVVCLVALLHVFSEGDVRVVFD